MNILLTIGILHLLLWSCKMRLLITGGAGYIGSVLLDELYRKYSEESFEVVVLDNLMFEQTSLIQYSERSNFKFVYKDVRGDFKEWFRWCDVFIPLACIVGYPACDKFGSEEEIYKINKEHVTKYLQILRPDQKIIFFVTNSGYGVGEKDENGELKYCTEETPLNPISLYGQSKVETERFLMKYAPHNTVCFRLATVFGSSARMRMDLLVNDFVWQAYKNKSVVLFEHEFKRNYIHIRDVAKTVFFSLNNWDKVVSNVYNVGLSSTNLSKKELCKKIQNYIPDFNIFYAEMGEDPDKRNYIVSNEKLESLGWNPEYDLDMGIKELIQVYETISNIRNPWGNV